MKPITERQTHDFIIDVLNKNLLKHTNFEPLFYEFFKIYAYAVTRYTLTIRHLFPPEFHVRQMIECDENYENVNTYVSSTYNYNSPLFDYSRQDSYDEIKPFLFFNQHCYNEFLTKENMRLYLPFAISNTVKHIMHLKNIIHSLNKFMQTDEANDVHDFIAKKLKADGMEPRKFTDYNQENAHNYLSEFPLYIIHVEQYFEKRKMEFVFVCDEIYKSYDTEIVGNRVAVDELIMMRVVKFL